MNNILEVKNLKTGFYINNSLETALDEVSFSVIKGETLGIVGESGSGKSVTALSILGLIDSAAGKVVSGEILYEGRDLLNISESEKRKIRGKKISMIFQEPMTSLNPLFTVSFQIGEALSLHMGLSGKEKRNRIIELLDLVKIPDAKNMLGRYPHELSGGMRQRVMIAMAISRNPSLLIADEPTTALDVTVQAQILNLLTEIQEELGMSLILITHDLGVVSRVCNNVFVMYGGRIVEKGTVTKVFSTPAHPYTKGLLSSIPKIGEKSQFLTTIEGVVPSIGRFPRGCRFLTRCPQKESQCESIPQLKNIAKDHDVACKIPIIPT